MSQLEICQTEAIKMLKAKRLSDQVLEDAEHLKRLLRENDFVFMSPWKMRHEIQRLEKRHLNLQQYAYKKATIILTNI